MPRLFVGLGVPDALRLTLSAATGGIEGARWVDPSDYHVTLRFIGDVDNATADRLADALSSVQAAPFELHTDGYGTFGADRPRLLHLAVRRDEALLALQRRVERAVREAGLAPESARYVPHVTLTRFRRVRSDQVTAWINSRLPPLPASWPVTVFHLYTARPGGGGPYDPAIDYRLDASVR